MLEQYAIVPFTKQAPERRHRMPADLQPESLSAHYATSLLRFVELLVRELDETVDTRPVHTLVQSVEAIIAFRDRCNGLVLSQLGSLLDGLGRGGGTKRLSTLIHHQNWKAQQIEEFLLRRADEQLSQWEDEGQDAMLIWDGTVLEKPESLAAEGLCAVRSSKAKRLTHVKKGYYHPPGMPIFVPGMHGIGLLLCAREPRMLDPLCWRLYAGGPRVGHSLAMKRMRTASSYA